MKNYLEILAEAGIELDDEQKATLKTSFGENYRAKADYDKVVSKRDEYKASLDEVQGQLDGYKDIDVDDLKSQIATLSQNLENAKNERKKAEARRQLEATVDAFLDEADGDGNKVRRFTDDEIIKPHVRAQLLEELEKDTAKGKSISELFDGITRDADGKVKKNILVDKQEDDLEKNKAKFSTSLGGKKKGDGADTFKAMSLDERIQLKNTNPELYAKMKNK